MPQLKSKGVIVILVARTNIIHNTLSLFYKNWNNKFQYPIYIHTFGNVINDKLKKKINREIDSGIKFFEIYPKVPSHIEEKDLFYNRTYHDYVKNTFSKKRIGFLHMCHFLLNITSFGREGCLSKELEDFDQLMYFDDDIFYKKEINFDLFEPLNKYPLVSAFTSRLEKNKTNLACIEGLWEFYKNYILSKNIVPKDKMLANAITNNDSDVLHKIELSAGCMELFDLTKFKNSNWYNFLDEINKSGGIYKYRWNTSFLTNLFVKTFYDKPIKDLNLLKSEIIDIKFPGSEEFIYFNQNDYYSSRIFRLLVDLKKKLLNIFK